MQVFKPFQVRSTDSLPNQHTAKPLSSFVKLLHTYFYRSPSQGERTAGMFGGNHTSDSLYLNGNSEFLKKKSSAAQRTSLTSRPAFPKKRKEKREWQRRAGDYLVVDEDKPADVRDQFVAAATAAATAARRRPLHRQFAAESWPLCFPSDAVRASSFIARPGAAAVVTLSWKSYDIPTETKDLVSVVRSVSKRERANAHSLGMVQGYRRMEPCLLIGRERADTYTPQNKFL